MDDTHCRDSLSVKVALKFTCGQADGKVEASTSKQTSALAYAAA